MAATAVQASTTLRRPAPARQRHVFVVCTGENCLGAGARDLLIELRAACESSGHELRISSCRCIGHCAAAPAMVEDGAVMRWMSLKRLRAELYRLGAL